LQPKQIGVIAILAEVGRTEVHNPALEILEDGCLPSATRWPTWLIAQSTQLAVGTPNKAQTRDFSINPGDAVGPTAAWVAGIQFSRLVDGGQRRKTRTFAGRLLKEVSNPVIAVLLPLCGHVALDVLPH